MSEVRRLAIGKWQGSGVRVVEPEQVPTPGLYWRPRALNKIPVGAVVGPVVFVDWYPRWDRKTARDMALVSSLVAPWAPPWVTFVDELRVRAEQ